MVSLRDDWIRLPEGELPERQERPAWAAAFGPRNDNVGNGVRRGRRPRRPGLRSKQPSEMVHGGSALRLPRRFAPRNDRTGGKAPLEGRDALSKHAGGMFVAKAGSRLCMRPGPKAVSAAD